MSKPSVLSTLVAAALLTSCVIGGNKHNRPRDLEDKWLVTKPRLLAIQAQPAEARPGDVVTFRALIADPTNEIDTVLWIACPVDEGEGGIGAGCIDVDQAVIGIEPFQPPLYQTSEDFLDELPEEARLEGRYINVQVTGLPPIDPAELEDGFDFESIDFNQVEAGYKRIVVSEALTPNRNPSIEAMGAEGKRMPDGTLLEVDPLQLYEISAFLTEADIEAYQFVNRDGIVEDRVEQPYVAWFTSAGVMAEAVTLYPFTQANWISPAESGTEGTIWAVVRDRRGGQAWKSLDFRVR